MLSPSPEEVGVYREETETNLKMRIQYDGDMRRPAGNSLVIDGTKELETRSNLLLGPICLNNGADDGNVNVLGTDIVGGRDLGDVDI